MLRWMLLLSGLMSMLGAPHAHGQTDAVRIAETMLDHLDAGEFEAAEDLFTEGMADAVPAERLAAIWRALPEQFGVRQERGAPEMSRQQGMQVVVVPLRHAGMTLLAQIVVDDQGRVAGFFVKPAPPPAPAAPEDAGYRERDLPVGPPQTALAGTLTLPDAQQAVPGVVLVHGSGPQDRDETIGPNRPFLDLARGLAERGIAVLRYDKRSHARPQDFAAGDYTLDDETTDDAVAAVAALRAVDGVAAERVFVLGHSQGGMLAPRIAMHSGGIAGLILFAAPARSLLELLPEQNRYLATLDGEISTQEAAFIERLGAQIAALRDSDGSGAPVELLGQPDAYWREIDALDPVADAQAVDLPLLLLQGGRDFQVTDTDWQRWQAALADDPRATMHYYPSLNHLGMPGSGAGSLAEYQRPGHVDAGLIDDVAAWILAQ